MNRTPGKTSSSLAITEKKTTRPGGCVGIFFQLFDWNRRLAKKKLFSKKLLPSARVKQAFKKFKGDEKMPNSKLHLIANENIGGFPSAKKGGNREVDVEQKNEMRIPGLVARLMGLESIPASQRDKSKKASFSDTCGDGEKESLTINHCESDRIGSNLETGPAKHESRPQKLLKTGIYERRAVTRLGTEALQIKSVISQARKHHHSKLSSPLKSPRITPGKNMSRNSRLIGAATKILEPGLQATSKAKCSIAYSGCMHHPKNEIAAEGTGAKSANLQNQSSYDASAAKPLIGQTSCNNCGNSLDIVDWSGDLEGQSVFPPHNVSDMINASSMVSGQRNTRPLVASHEQERDKAVLRSQKQLIASVAEETGKSNTQSSVAFVPKPHIEEHIFGSERISHGSKMRNILVNRVSSAANTMNGTKDFVALNRSLSGQTRLRSPTKLDNSKFDLERKLCNRQDDSLSRRKPVEWKRRTPNVRLVENSAPVNSTTVKQRTLCSNLPGGKRRDSNASIRNSKNVKSKRCHQGKTDKINENKVDGVLIVTSNSSLKHKTGIPSEKEETSCDNEINTYMQKPLPLKGDALGAFLEQKLKELTSQEDEELTTGAPPKKSTAMILQELISALSSDHLACHDGHMVNTDIGSHDGPKKERLLGASCDGNHLSPGSVLDASFSSSSLDESSGSGLHSDFMNYSYDQLEQSEYEGELLDSASSFSKGKLGSEAFTDLVSQIIPRVLQCVDSSRATLTSWLTHVKDVILKAELLLGNATLDNKEEPHLSIVCFLDEMDTIADDALVGCENFKERKELKGFLFDCVVEYLESVCCRYCNCGFKAWKKLPLWMKAEMLIQEVKREIKKWASIAGMIPDEIIEWEMSHSLGKWTDFDIEAFEAGVEIDGDILQILVDEIVEDLVEESI